MIVYKIMNKEIFPAETYYIGDLCYVVPDSRWIPLLERTDYLTCGVFKYRRVKCYADSTAYGDGAYKDNLGNIYPVDAGLIGIMPVSVIDKTEKEMKGFGSVVVFKDNFQVYSLNGKFYFGHILINTN